MGFRSGPSHTQGAGSIYTAGFPNSNFWTRPTKTDVFFPLTAVPTYYLDKLQHAIVVYLSDTAALQ